MYNFSNMFEYGLLFYQPTVGLALYVSNGPQAEGRQQYPGKISPFFAGSTSYLLCYLETIAYFSEHEFIGVSVADNSELPPMVFL